MSITFRIIIAIALATTLTSVSRADDQLGCKSVLAELRDDVRDRYAKSDPIKRVAIRRIWTIESITATTLWGDSPGYECGAEVEVEHVTGTQKVIKVKFSVVNMGQFVAHGIKEID